MRSETISDNIISDKWAAVIYLMLVVLFTWPLIIKINSVVPGIGNDMGDTFHFIWDMWWIKHSVANGDNVLLTDYLFFPNGVSLVYHTLLIGQSVLALPFLFFLPLLAVFNLFYLLFFWLAAMFAFWLSRLYWKNSWSAFIAGLIYAFSPYVMAHSLGHFNLTAIWVFPAVIFMIRKSEILNRRIWLIGAGLVMSFTLLNDYQYFVFLSMLTGLYFIYQIIITRQLADYFGRWLILVVIPFLLGFPLIFYSLKTIKTYLPSALLSEVSYWSADLAAYVIPSFLHPIWGGVGQFYQTNYFLTGVESVSYVGWTVIGLLVIGLIIGLGEKEKKDVRFWQLSLLVFLILSLGPFLKILGNTEFTVSDSKFEIILPYVLMFKVPLMTIARVPARFYVLISLSLAMLGSYVLHRMMKRVNMYTGGWNLAWKFVIVFFFAVLILTEYVSLPFKYQPVSIPPVYTEIKKDTTDFTLLELPLWWSSGHRLEGDARTIIQYYQTYHEKKILNGSVSRVPDALFDYYQTIPGIKYLIDSKQVPDDDDLNRGLVLYTWERELNIGYIILHKKYFSVEEYYQLRSYLENQLQLPVSYEDNGEILYKMMNELSIQSI